MRKTLIGLAGQNTEHLFEVIVVCDGPDVESRQFAHEYVAPFPIQWIFRQESCGAGAARNAGVEVASASLISFLDDDTVPKPSWLENHCIHHVDNAGGNLIVVGQTIDLFQRAPLSSREAFMRVVRKRAIRAHESSLLDHGDESITEEVHFWRSVGVNCSISRAQFLAAGGFDETLVYCSEDMELGSRMADRGAQFCYEPRAIVEHYDTKDLVAYHRRCWQVSGKYDFYRANEKNQRNPQTRGLVAVRRGPAQRALAYTAYEYPDAIRAVVDALGVSAEFTKLELLASAWSALDFRLSYWQGLRSSGVTMDAIEKLVGSPVTALAFHGVFDPISSAERLYHLSPGRFRQVLSWLSRRYTFANPEEAFSGTLPNPAILTFDDGYEDFYFEVFPQLAAIDNKATVFLVLDEIGGANQWDLSCGARALKLLNAAQIREMHRQGIRFGSHTLSHPLLTRVADDQLRAEIFDSKARLEDLLGAEVCCFAYPYGNVDSRVRAVVAEAGYTYAFGVNSGTNLWEDRLALRRVSISETDSAFEILLKTWTGRDLRGDARVFKKRMSTALRKASHWVRVPNQ